MNSIKVAIADDHKIFRKGLMASLGDYKNIQIVQEANNGQELIDKLSLSKPDVVLMDIKMPVMDGMKATEYITGEFDSIKVLALSMYDDDKYIINMMKAGARGYLLKSAEPSEIIQALSTVYQKQYYFNEYLSVALVNKLIDKKKPTSESLRVDLTEREVDVLKLICKELTNQEIGDKLFVSVRTVEGYRTKLFEKIGAKNIVGLVIFALKNDFIDINEL